jgi:hypothetical protein
MKIFLAMILFTATAAAQSVAETTQTAGAQTSAPKSESNRTAKPAPGAGKDIGGGAANVGEGAAKGAGDVAKGTAKGAVDLVTLHPIGAATSVAGGAASAGKDVVVGGAKGVGKITRGVGKLFKKVL